MTTGISLVRENTASMRPPRSLWVSFPLGRPLGNPGDSAVQHRVIAAALALLNRSAGPVLEDFPEELPAAQPTDAPSCPVSFTSPTDNTSWRGKLLKELGSLEPWYDLAKRSRQGRTAVGVSDQSAQANMAKLGQLLDDQQLPLTELAWFKHAIEDLKVYYLEALTAQPGNYTVEALQQTLWQDTALGAALKSFYHQFCALKEPQLQVFARIILPREMAGEATGKSRAKEPGAD